MLAQSEAEPDPARRLQIFHDMEKLLVEDEVPIVPVSFMVGSVLYWPGKLGGFEPNFVDDHRWGDFYIPGKK
jgi:oligopeptide transport system substrate-binding protein